MLKLGITEDEVGDDLPVTFDNIDRVQTFDDEDSTIGGILSSQQAEHITLSVNGEEGTFHATSTPTVTATQIPIYS